MHSQNQSKPSQHSHYSHFPFKINKTKKITTPQLHAHFYLNNIKWKSKQPKKQQKLIQNTIHILNKFCKTKTVQISSIPKDQTYDLSITLLDDMEAYQFINKKQPITLSDGIYNQYQYFPVISNTFRSQMSKIQYELASRRMSNQNIIPQPEKQQQKKIQKIDEIQPQEKAKCSQHNERQKQQNWKVNKIWAFGIPKQFQIQQIKSSLKNYKLQAGKCRWKIKQHMQYLQIQLLQQISKTSIYYLGLSIQGYPYVILPVVDQNKITRELSRYTVEIIVRQSEDDQQKFMEAMNQIGGVNIMLRTPIKQKKQFRYIVVFNNVGNAEIACRVAKNLRNCTANHKQYQLKLGRLCKFYTFTELMREHLLDQ